MRHSIGPREVAIGLFLILLGVVFWFSTKVLDYSEIKSTIFQELGLFQEQHIEETEELEQQSEQDVTVEEAIETDSTTVVPEETVPLAPEPEPEPEPYRFTLLGVGDNLIHRGLYLQAAGREGNRYDFGYVYTELAEHIQSATIASINQETMIAKSFEPSSYPRFNTPVEMAIALQELGFDVVNLANNHMFDMGDLGLWETLDLLRIEGFTVTGAYYHQEDYLQIPVLTVEDTTIAFVGTTQVTNGLSLGPTTELYASVSNSDAQVEEFLQQVARAKAVADLVVVNVHWGTEYSSTINQFQGDFAQRMVEAGADVILGHHPHVLQPVEYLYASDGRRAVVAYSLGNFVSAQDTAARMIGGMLQVEFLVEGEEISIDSVVLSPVITHYESNYNNIRVYPYEKYSSDLANTHGVKSFSSFSYNFIYQTVTSIVSGEFLPEDFHLLYG